MGCTGSKEDKKASSTSTANGAAAADADKPIPIKKVRTNFSDVHYDEPAQGRRDTTYAPSEIPESRRPTEAGDTPGTNNVNVNSNSSDGEVNGRPAGDVSAAVATLPGAGQQAIPVPPPNVSADGMLSPRSTSVAPPSTS